jgi:hypothetical protein
MFSAEYKREALVAIFDTPGVNVSQSPAELGIGVSVLGRCRSRGEEVGHLHREWCQGPSFLLRLTDTYPSWR